MRSRRCRFTLCLSMRDIRVEAQRTSPHSLMMVFSSQPPVRKCLLSFRNLISPVNRKINFLNFKTQVCFFFPTSLQTDDPEHTEFLNHTGHPGVSQIPAFQTHRDAKHAVQLRQAGIRNAPRQLVAAFSLPKTCLPLYTSS